MVGIARLEQGSIVTAVVEEEIVGYATLHPPDSFERWGETKLPGILELGAVESSPRYRSRHLARRMLERMFEGGRCEENIVVATLYYWHYDLEGSGLSTYAYRKLLERLYGSVGFEVYKTDDPEIAHYPGNALMARVGSRVSPELLAEFERLRFLIRWRTQQSAS
nr:GNAT family N-acetyltransferase [Deinobacterium chartae]